MPDNELPKIPEQTSEAMAEREDYEKIRAELTQSGLNAEAYTDELLNWMKTQGNFKGTYDDLMKLATDSDEDDLSGYNFVLEAALSAYEQEQTAAPTTPVAPTASEAVKNPAFDALVASFKNTVEAQLKTVAQTDKTKAENLQKEFDAAVASGDIEKVNQAYKKVGEAFDVAAKAQVAPAAPEAAAPKSPEQVQLEKFENTKNALDPAVTGPEGLLSVLEKKDKNVADKMRALWQIALDSKNPENLQATYTIIAGVTQDTPQASITPEASVTPETPKAPEATTLSPDFKRQMEELDPSAVQLIAAIKSVDKEQADAFQLSWDSAKKSNNLDTLRATFDTIQKAADSKKNSVKAPEVQTDLQKFEALKSAFEPNVTNVLLPIIEAKNPTLLAVYKQIWTNAINSKNPTALDDAYKAIATTAAQLGASPNAPAPATPAPEAPAAPEAQTDLQKFEALKSAFEPNVTNVLFPIIEAKNPTMLAVYKQIWTNAINSKNPTTLDDAYKAIATTAAQLGASPNAPAPATPDAAAPTPAPAPTAPGTTPAPAPTTPTAPDAAAPAPGPDATTPDSNPIDIWGTGVQDNLENIRKLDPTRADALAKEWEDIKAAGDQTQALAKANEITKESQKTLESLSHVGETLSEVDAEKYGLIEKRVDDNGDGAIDEKDHWYPKPALDWIDKDSTSNFGVKFKEGSADEATAGEPAAPGATAPGDTGSTGGSSSSGSRERRETSSEVDFKGTLKANPDKYVKQETVDGKTKVTLTDVPDRGSRIQHIVGPDGVIKIEADKLATTVLTAGGTEYRWDGSSWSNDGRRLYVGASYAKEFTISEGAAASVGGTSGGSTGAETGSDKEPSSELLIALPGKPDTYQAAKDIDNLATTIPSIDKYLGLRGSSKLPDRVEKDGVTYTLVRGENVKSDETGDTATHPGAPIEYRSARGVLKIKQGETFKVYFDAAPAAAAPAPATGVETAPEGNVLQKGMQTLIERVIVMPGKEKELVKNVNAKLTGKTFQSLTFKDAEGMGQTVTLTVRNPDGTEKTYTGDTDRTVGVNALAGKTPNPFGGAEIQMNAWNRDALRNLFEKIASAA